MRIATSEKSTALTPDFLRSSPTTEPTSVGLALESWSAGNFLPKSKPTPLWATLH